MSREEEIKILIGGIVTNTWSTLNNDLGDRDKCTHAILQAAEQLQVYANEINILKAKENEHG